MRFTLETPLDLFKGSRMIVSMYTINHVFIEHAFVKGYQLLVTNPKTNFWHLKVKKKELQINDETFLVESNERNKERFVDF